MRTLRANGATGYGYAPGQWLTIRQPDGQWGDFQVSAYGPGRNPKDSRGPGDAQVTMLVHPCSDRASQDLPLHPWNHAPRELPHADFEALWSWWVQTLQVQH